jgi:uncharacterized protein YmfQ (DUF2313 family)
MGVARSTDDVMAELLALSPPGWAINKEPDSMFAAFMRPLADAISTFEKQAYEELIEVDPRAAVALLPDFERMLGPDPYGRDLTDVTQQQRQLVAYQRLTARGGQSIAYFVGLAASLGVTISITEKRTSVCGRSRCGADRLAPSPAQFVWVVTLPSTTVTKSYCGGSRCGASSLGTITPSPVQPAILRDAPAHTQPIFSFTG